MKISVLCLTAILTAEASAALRTLQVPGDYPTIQQAITASQDGDVVLVAPGVYAETIDFLGKAITVKSTDGPALTTIDANQLGSVVTFQNGEDCDSVIEGFTITGGSGSGATGGGVTCLDAFPTILGNHIIANSSSIGGGILVAQWSGQTDGAVVIANNIISQNSARDGAGILTSHVNDRTSTLLAGNIITDNTASRDGGGVWTECVSGPGASLSVKNCTIAYNAAAGFGGGVCVLFGSAAVVENSILWENSAASGQEAYVGSAGGIGPSSWSMKFCDVRGLRSRITADQGSLVFLGAGLIDADPLFANQAAGDYHLTQWSPCIDAGASVLAPAIPAVDIDGQARIAPARKRYAIKNGPPKKPAVDLGADEFHEF